LGFGVILLALSYSAWFGMLLFVMVFFFGALVRRTRCPHCVQPVLLRHLRIGGLRIPYWSTTVPDVCGHCGEKLE